MGSPRESKRENACVCVQERPTTRSSEYSHILLFLHLVHYLNILYIITFDQRDIRRKTYLYRSFSAKKPIISGSFVQNDLQLRAIYVVYHNI